MNPVLIWFIAGLVLMLLEFAVPGVILVFFGLGAWVAAITTAIGFTSSLEAQIAVFTVSSIALLAILRKWIRDKFIGHVTGVQDPGTNLDEFTGKSVMVLSDIIPGTPGKVEFKGAHWSATSEENISAGERAIILGLDGLTLRVKKA